MNIPDMLSQTKESLFERATNPIISTFFVSWIIFNWRVVFVFFSSSEGYHQKISFINNLVNSNTPSVFLYPAMLTVFVIFILPIPTQYVVKHIAESNTELVNIKRAAQRKQLLSEEKSAELYNQFDTISNQFSERIAQKNKEIASLTASVEQEKQKAEDARAAVEAIGTIRPPEEVVQENLSLRAEIVELKKEISKIQTKQFSSIEVPIPDHLDDLETLWFKELRSMHGQELLMNFKRVMNDLLLGNNLHSAFDSSLTNALKLLDLVESKGVYLQLTLKGRFLAKQITLGNI